MPATYPDYKTMLDREQLDIVSVCTPTSTHVSIGLDVVANGVRAVFMELETGQPPSSDESSARSDLELRVAFQVADQTRGVVTLPIADVDYAIADPWGRYS